VPLLQASKYGMHAVMLTVMNANTGARAFYSALGYTTHSSTPGYDDPTGDAGYQILWKPLSSSRGPQQQQQQQQARGLLTSQLLRQEEEWQQGQQLLRWRHQQHADNLRGSSVPIR
jgi:hypothetical protein